MKYTFITTLFLAIFLGAANVEAHTHLQKTDPANGAVITTEISSISLTYDGQIEQGSSFELNSAEGQKIDVQTFTIDNGKLTGTLSQPLENNEYRVVWSSISQDGHPMTGEFSFLVDVPQAAEASDSSTTVEEKPEASTNQSVEQNEPAKQSTLSSKMFLIVGLLFAIVLVSTILAMRRKR
ncbi:copper resistance CopC family protein [Lysinibacillus sp. 54212]|uniref:copper resistance CopC family protein n=1 Tax=Lysinibacillus sp. 54212 TaxID=3119829 RepID=UPI002FC83C14